MSIEIAIKCLHCEKDLDIYMIKDTIYPDPCPRCLEKEKKTAYAKGYEQGREDELKQKISVPVEVEEEG